MKKLLTCFFLLFFLCADSALANGNDTVPPLSETTTDNVPANTPATPTPEEIAAAALKAEEDKKRLEDEAEERRKGREESEAEFKEHDRSGHDPKNRLVTLRKTAEGFEVNKPSVPHRKAVFPLYCLDIANKCYDFLISCSHN